MAQQSNNDNNDCNINVTKQIVHCYIREAESLFPTINNPYYNIPVGICNLISSYIHNFCDNSGLYEWKIDNINLINQMMNATCGTKFESDSFILSRIKCKLIIYPNGNNEDLKGYFVIHLYLSLPSFINKITFVRVFRIKENMSGSSWLTTLSNGEYEWWSKNAPLSELQKLKCKTITIQIELNIQRLYLNNDFNFNILKNNKLPSIKPHIPMTTHIEYNFNEKQFKVLLNSKGGKCLCSDIINNMWSIAIYPDGSSEQYIDFYLELCCLPSNVNSIEAYYIIKCNLISEELVFRNTFSAEHYSAGKEKWLPLNVVKQIQNIKSLTFTIDVKIENINYATDNKQLEISNPSQITFLLSV
eukprot:405455_1